MVALHLDNSTAKAYLCNQGGTTSLSSFQASLLHFESGQMCGITLIPAYIPTHLNVEAEYLSQGRLVPEWHLFPHIAQAAFHFWVQPEVDMVAP